MMQQAGSSRGHNPCAIHILAGVLIVMFVALPYQILGNNNAPVCYLKTKLDKTNIHITKIDCADAENFNWSQVTRFETRSDVSMTELLKNSDDTRAAITPFKTGQRQDQDSEKILLTVSQGASQKGTEKPLDNRKETSSTRSHVTSMTVTEERQDKIRETASISPYATKMAGTGKLEDIERGVQSIESNATSMDAAENRKNDARETPDAISMTEIQKSGDNRSVAPSIEAHATWMPGTNKDQDDAGETTSITSDDVPMLKTQKSQDDATGISSTGSHNTRVPRTNRRYDDPRETKSIEPYIWSMASTEKNQGNMRETLLMEAHATSKMELLDTLYTSSPEIQYQTLGTSSGKKATSATGTRYYYAFTFLPLTNSGCTIEAVEIYIASLSTVTVNGTIIFPFQDIVNISFALAYGKGDAWELPLTVVPQESDMNGIVNTTIVIETDEMVTVVGQQRCEGGKFRSTAFRVRHIASLGTEYLLLTYHVIGVTQAGIVALNDGTSVWINGSLQNMDKYEAYFLGGGFDVTGTNVTSNQPVAVLVGNRDEVTFSSGKDTFFEYLAPCSSWGQRFLVPPFPLFENLKYNYTVRIVARYDGTNVTLSTKDSSHALTNVLSGNVITRLVDSKNVLEVSSSKPILVAKFLTRNSKGSMVFISPINSSHVKSVAIQILESTETAFINVWLPSGNNSTALSFNGSTNITWKLVGNDSEGNSIVQLPLTGNRATYTLHSRENFGITAVVYGSSVYRCYSYPLP